MENYDSKGKGSALQKFNSKSTSYETNGRSSSNGTLKEILNPNSDKLKIDDKVFVNGQNPGIIKFLGETSFAPGIWSGIELVEKNGKNDGSVNGIRYFTCESNYGIFVRPYRLTLEPLISQTSLNASQVDGTLDYKSSMSQISKVTMTNGVGTNLKVGDRVLINASSGLKKGILRYLGSTDFASGNWAGVELNEASGKNDGAVGGKRYFTCPVNYGLFAPLHKVTKDVAGSRLLSTRKSVVPTSNLSSLIKTGPKGSQESLASNASTTSRKSSRIKLGINSLTDTRSKLSQIDSDLNSSLTSALQKTLKEKEFQISQLLKERDFETNELAKANSRAKLSEDQFFAFKNEQQALIHKKETQIEDLKRAIDDGNAMIKTLTAQNEEEKRKVEILEFRLEEEFMNKIEMKEEMERLINNQKSVHKEEDNEMELFQLQEEIIKKDEKIIQLESMLDKKKPEVENLLSRIKELEAKVSSFDQRREKQLKTIDELNLKLKKREDELERCNEELNRKNEQIIKFQKNTKEILKKSGDDSGQLNMLIDKLRRSEDEKAQIENEFQKIKYELENDKKTQVHLEKEIKTLKKEIVEKENQATLFQNKEKQLTEELQHKEVMIEKLNKQFNQILLKSGSNDEVLENLNQELRDKEKKFDNLNDKIRKMNQEMEELKIEKNMMINQNQQLRNNLNDKNDQVNLFKKKIDEMKEDIKLDSDKKKALEEQIRDLLKSKADGNAHLINLNEDLMKKHKEINDLQDTLSLVKKQLHESDVEKRKCQAEFQELKRAENYVSESLEKLEKKKMEIIQEKDLLLVEVNELKNKNHELEEEKIKLKKEIYISKSGTEEKDEMLKKLRDQIETNSQEFDDYRRKLKKEVSKLREDSDSLIKELKDELRTCETKNRQLKLANSESQAKIEKLVLDLENMESKQTKTKTEFELEIKHLKNELEEKKLLLEKVKLETSSNSDNESKKPDQKTENFVNTIEILKNSINHLNSQLINQSQDYETQIDFLNSVIVDMQEKIDSLKIKLKVYEEIGLSDLDISMNVVKPANGYLPKPPRTFCDICDVFDSHETDDCPLQMKQDQEMLIHSRFNGKRNEERPFCNKCEMFGHSSDNCENESF